MRSRQFTIVGNVKLLKLKLDKHKLKEHKRKAREIREEKEIST